LFRAMGSLFLISIISKTRRLPKFDSLPITFTF
jgi:hypothetical protein